MFLFIERLLNTLLVLFAFGYTTAKEITAKQVIVSQVGALASITTNVIVVVVKIWVYILSWWLLIAIVVTIFSILYVSFEETPIVWINIVMMYNTVFGPWIGEAIILPAYIFDLLLKSTLPFWNASVWFTKTLLSQGILPLVLDQIKTFIKVITNLVFLVQALANALIDYIVAFKCTSSYCLNIQTLNLITPLGYLKETIAQSLVLTRSLCSYMSVPLDILTYPIMDMNLALSLHNIFNGMMQLFIGIPYTTVARCNMANDNSYKILMCTPDINPMFSYWVAGVTHLGMLIDNWLNIVLVIVQEALTGNSIACQDVNGISIADIMTSTSLFPTSDPLTVVGLTGWVYAITNGRTLVYKGHSSDASKVGTWPYAVNPLYGIAAVSYSNVNDIIVSAVGDGTTYTSLQTTSLLGCNCTDDNTEGVVITCAITPYNGWSGVNRTKYRLQVLFPDTNTPRSLKCAWIDIHVKSNRFSFQRYSSVDVNYGEGTTAMPSTDCISRSNCREVDTSIWVVPRCGQDIGQVIDACIPGSHCFPYCMGVRVSGSANNNIILSSALLWKSGKTLIHRDCSIYDSNPTTTFQSNQLNSAFTQGSGTILGSNISKTVFSSKNTQNNVLIPECYPVKDVISQVSSTEYVASKYNTYSKNQPFVITGDAVFTAKDLGGSVSSVVIDRLESDEKNEFTMHTLNQDFPAEAPPNVPQDETKILNQDKILLPYSTRIGHPVATSSRNYVFYASNPDYGVFETYLDYCNRKPNSLPKFGLLITSSYGPLRIYRVKAYAKCQAFSCGAGLVRSIDFDGFKTDYSTKCNGALNVSITQLEYLNEDNIVVVVSSSPVNAYDTDTKQFTTSTNTIYWLNPATMQIASSIWQTSVSKSTVGVLCPALQRLPRIGSLVAEILSSNLYLFQYIVGVPLYLPGMIPIWLDGGKCAQQTYSHAILANCGNDIFSLENMFDSLADAASIFWHSLNSISYMIQFNNNGKPVSNPLSDILDGMAEYGEGTIDYAAISSSVLTLSKIPLKEQIPTLVASIQSGGIFSSISNAQSNMLMWARFYYNVIVEVLLVIIKSSLKNNQMTSSEIWQALWNTLYNLRGYYQSTVVETNVMACSGIKLMLGVDNPWASMGYYMCTASTGFIDAVLDTFIDITVYVPMSVCICKEGTGRNLIQYAVSTCSKKLPLQVRPELYVLSSYVQEQGNGGGTLCDTILDHTRNKIIHSMDPYFINMQAMLVAMSEAIDYLLILFDSQAGKCLDFQGNPHVIAIVPQPIDYFQACGKTTSCKTKCSSEWQLFEEYKTTPVQLPTVSIDYESMFFPGQYDSTNSMQNVVAVMEIPASTIHCLAKAGPSDYVLFISESINNVITTNVWCIPQSPSSSVYKSETVSSFPTVTLPGDIMKIYFVNQDMICMLLRVGSNNEIYLLDPTRGLSKAPTINLNDDEILVNVLNIWPIMDTVFIDIIIRRYQNTLSTYTPVSYIYSYYLNAFKWVRVSKFDINALAANYQITRSNVNTWEYLMMPTQSYYEAYTLLVTRLEGGDVQTELTILKALDPMNTISMAYNTIISCHIVSPTYVFAVATQEWDWLKQIRFQVVGTQRQITSIKKSSKVPMEIIPQGNCDENSCEGCKSLLVQRLCQAYNKCALVRCIGTLVNEMRPLCAVGQTLAFTGSEALQRTQGAWVIISEMLCTTLKLSLTSTKSLNIEWPDDVFMGYICNAKDLYVEFWAIFTSTINVLMHVANTNPVQTFKGSSKIDKNVDAALTIRSTALNAFLAQLTLFPLYQLIAMKQIVSCQINGVLAITDSTGYGIRIISPDLVNATDVVAGSCLTLSNQIASQSMSNESSSTEARKSTYGNIVDFAGSAINFVILQSIDPFIHIIDSAATYAIGIIHTLAVLVMAIYPDACNPPDYFLTETIQCACDDYRLSIPSIRSEALMNQYPLWCTGTLGMIDSSNQPVIVYNPYTYAELQEKASSLQEFVECMSQNYNCNGPYDAIFDVQGVTLVNVLVKCRENYMKKQWDPKAYAFFYTEDTSSKRFNFPDTSVKDCLLEYHNNGAGPQACQEAYLNTLNLRSSEEYWAYERATVERPEYTDSCLVFTGPGLVHNISSFAACVDDVNTGTTSDCKLNAQIWSVLSTNDIPIAEPHIVLYKGVQASGVIQKIYKEAHEKVTTAIMEAIYVWGNESNPDVNVDFFSTEGDAIHQILDCMYMGPYSRINYWPIPLPRENEEILYGPSWYRDENHGKSRTIDINTCDGGEIMPYTCGSSSRKSVIKFFVKQMLSRSKRNNVNSTLIQQVILKQLRDILSQWSNSSTYGCVCANNLDHHPNCCNENSSNWLSPALQMEFHDIESSHVLDALQDEYESLYNITMQNNLPWLFNNQDYNDGLYNWQDSIRAKKEGLLNPFQSANNYSNIMNLTTDNSMLWGLCHASLKQVFFTVPVTNNNIKSLDQLMLYDGDPAQLEATIQSIVLTALEDSPTYRHYYARYHPSPSLMCDDPGTSSTDFVSTFGNSQYNDYAQGGSTLLQAKEVLSKDNQVISLYTWDYTYLALGNKTCTCGWQYIPSLNKCIIPQTLGTCTYICQMISCHPLECSYDVSLDASVPAYINEDCFCPMFELSAHWGILNEEAVKLWMQGSKNLVLSTKDLLKYGRSGLRLGNIGDIQKNAQTYINEDNRVIPLKNGVITSCDYDKQLKLNPLFLAHELFPVVQGIEEGAVASYCLRYFIEKARYMVLNFTYGLVNDTNLTVEYLKQQELMYIWGQKCGSQLYLLHLCVSLDVFKPAMDFNLQQQTCLYFEVENAPQFYLTAECLVQLNGEFYDPCRCLECKSNLYDGSNKIKLNATYLSKNAECKLRFNPIKKATNLNAPIGWWDGEAVEYLDFLNMSLLESLVNDPDAVGNTPYTKSWMSAEGYMSTEADDCDMLVDYWPDNMDYPVGYHVSTVCDAEDNAYRSFSNSFTVESKNTKIKYQNDIMRDMYDIDQLYGVGGLCRQNNFGMDMVVLNTLVYCTRVKLGEEVDYTIPNFNNHDLDDLYTDEKCSSDSTELPWDPVDLQTKYTSWGVSIGTVPNLPQENSKNYPESLADTFDIASRQHVIDSWGSTCSDYNILQCSPDTLCPADYSCKGRKCSLISEYVPCTTNTICVAYDSLSVCKGVCMQNSVDCIRHYDCKNKPEYKDYMCNGVGKCVEPQIIIKNQNELVDMRVEFQVQGGEQKDLGDTYTLAGGSYWGYMGSDLLRVHGMCSYTDWYKYKNYIQPHCGPGSTSEVCWIDPATTLNYDVLLPSTNQHNYWWNNNESQKHPNIMYIRPTNCDRDYERLDNFTLHRPRLGDVTFQPDKSSNVPENLMYDNFTRAYMLHTMSRIPLLKLDTQSPGAFLFGSVLQDKIQDIANNPDLLRSCNTIRQCIKSPFTLNFVNVQRQVKINNQLVLYKKEDTFICGAIGFLNSEKQCEIDANVFPLYSFLCKNDNYLQSACKTYNIISESIRIDTCKSITSPYDANYMNIQRNVAGLIALFYIFNNQIDSYENIMAITDCAQDIYSHIKSTKPSNTLYYPFPFILKEFPYDFFFQCILLTDNFRIIGSEPGDQTCTAYKQKNTPPITTTDLIEYLKYTRLGFSMRKFETYKMQMLAKGEEAINTISSTFLLPLYPLNEDQSRPICSRFRRWKPDLGPAKNSLIANFYKSSTCQTSRIDSLIDIINKNEKETYFRNILEVNELTWLLNAENIPSTTISSSFKRVISYDFDIENWFLLLSETLLDDTIINQWNLPSTPRASKTLIEVVTNHIMQEWGYQQPENSNDIQWMYNITDVSRIILNIDSNLGIQPSSVISIVKDNTKDVQCAYPIDQEFPNPPLPTCESQSDGTRKCNGIPCDTIPKNALKGKFMCHYHYLDKLDPTLDVTNVQSVYRFIYNYIASAFKLQAARFQVEELDFFKDTAWQTNWNFNLSSTLDYILNNQPDTTKTVMCSVSDELIIDYTKCNHPYWSKLKKHAEQYYYHQGGIIVDRAAQMTWKVKSSMLYTGFITTYSSMNKTDRLLENYLKRLFDENTACKAATPNSAVCYMYTQNGVPSLNVINPWLHGFYNPYTHCDVDFTGTTPDASEYIDTFIYEEPNKKPYPEDMPQGEVCYNKKDQKVVKAGPSRFGVDPQYPSDDSHYNLCHHVIADGINCDHDQGILGNDGGMPVGAPDYTFNMFYDSAYPDEYNAYTVARNMYTYSTWKIPLDYQGGLFSNTNPLWKGISGLTGFLQVPEYELGVHAIEMTITPPNVSAGDTYSSLLVTYLPLTSFNSNPVQDWVPGLIDGLMADHITNQLENDVNYMQRSDQNFDVTCPLKRFAFYGRNNSEFKATSPSPLRNRVLFSHINRGTLAHPTMTQATNGEFIGTYKTVNGFCFCPFVYGVMQTQCQIPIGVTSTCSLDHTINTLKASDNIWWDSYVFASQDELGNPKTCNMQVDWPFIAFPLRDGSTDSVTYMDAWALASDSKNHQCHVLDRLAPFQYKYKNTRMVKSTGKNTVSHGVCKTSRLSSDAFVSTARCTKSQTNQANTFHKCDDASTLKELKRKKVINEQDMYVKYKKIKRTKCKKCAAPPTFVDALNNPIKAESSFGVPYRLSASKVLANDLKQVFKNAKLSHLIDETYWTPSVFLKTYLQNPHLLLTVSKLKPPSSKPVSPSWKVDDTERWKKPWVFCPTPNDFKNNTCVGVISRQDWITKKTSMCPAVIKTLMQNSKQDPMSRVSFASIDKYTNKVAVAIQEARELVLQANCIAAGMSYCLPRPFTYHPASYETTNRAWIHDTVVQYYKSVNSTACTASETSSTFLAYMQDKQIECPANNLYLFETIFVIIRFFITQVALLISSLASVLVKLVAAAFNPSVTPSLEKEWKFLVSKFDTLFSHLSDLMVNMLMNSGELGKSLMKFIQNTCDYINDAFAWFVDVWCIYIQKYLITFLQLSKKFYGYVEGAFRVISEFVEYLLKYFLPIAMVQRYASTAVQAYMLDKYSEPSDKTEKNQRNKVVKDKPQSRLVSSQNTRNTGSFVSNAPIKSFAKAAAGALFLEGLAWGMDEIAERQRGGLIDKIWSPINSVFDFDFIKDAVENIIDFLTNDERCSSYLFFKEHNKDLNILKCPKFDIDPTGPTTVAKSIAPTLCWATSNPTLGESSMYSCTAGSTCCPASGCSSSKINNVLCNDCPYPSNPDISRYACDNQVCKCGVAMQKISFCQSNEYCDSSAYCDLISMVSSASFGTLPCKECPGKIMCISDSTTGKCGCIMDKSVHMATCFESPGVFTYPNPTHLCGYLPRLSADSTQSVFQYRDLMGILCSKSVRTICASVIMDDGYSTFMPVSYAIRQSGSSRRRHLLLSADDEFKINMPSVYSYENDYDLLDYKHMDRIIHLPFWNLSSAPCSLLAMAYQHNQTLGILERHELSKCAYWRYVGQNIIHEHNLSSLKHLETFLVSMDDLSAALTHKNVFWDILATPHVVTKIILMHPWLKPLRAFVIVIANMVENVIRQDSGGHVDDEISKKFRAHLHKKLLNQSVLLENKTSTQQKKIEILRSMFSQNVKNKTKYKKNKKNIDPIAMFFRVINNVSRNVKNESKNTNKKQSPMRKLLGTLSEVEAVKQYSQDIMSGKINPPISLTVAQSWLRGPYSWPPKYEYSISTCPIVIVTRDSAFEIFSVLALYFQHMTDEKPPISRSLRHNLPQFIFPLENKTNILYNQKSWPSWIYYNFLKQISLDPRHVEEFFVGNEQWTLLWIVQTSLQCDFASAMSCSRHTKDLFASTIVFLLFYVIIKIIADALGSPVLATLFFFNYPFFILWYTYGFSPNCLPMLPTCIFTDVINLISDLLPVEYKFPALLYATSDHTLSQATKLKSCSDIGFTDAMDPISYSVCSLDSIVCDNLVKATNNTVFYLVSKALQKWNRVLTRQEQQAYSFCSWITWVQSLPYIFFFFILSFAISVGMYALVEMIPIFINIISQIIVYNHTH